MQVTGIHPYADKFPMLPPEEHAELRESIRTNGQRNPIITDRDGLIIDGRNRFKACEDLSISPVISVYEGDDIAEYVIDCNVTRRNMSTGARAMATALVLADDGRRENGRWAYGHLNSNDLGNSMAEYIRQCGVVIDFKPDLAEQVVAGAVTLNDAFGQAKAVKDSAERDKIMAREQAKREKEEAAAEAERNARIIADLTQAESKYLPLIEDGTMTPAAAWGAHNADHKKAIERQKAERQNDIEQARKILNILERVEFLAVEMQRDWCIRAVRENPDAIAHHHPENHTPPKIREAAQSLFTYADELEQANAA